MPDPIATNAPERFDPSTPTTLPEWLAYQQRVHPDAIALGLDRVRTVARRLRLARPARRVVTIGGTNGKGSTVAFVEAIARAAGLRVGCYTSPHLQRYNERVRIDGRDADDAALIGAFAQIETARLDDEPVALTYFEFGTLAALLLLEQAGLDLAVLEVGLGGRLDAVNLVDADVAVITTVDIDHADLLGCDREAIGMEKAGIARAGRPLVLGEADPPASVLRHAYRIGAVAIRGGSDYLIDRHDALMDPRLGDVTDPRPTAGWRWREPGYALDLPLPALAAPAQLANAAAAVAALRALDLDIPDAAFAQGVATAHVRGRLQRLAGPGGVEVILDVAHNPQAARQLADWVALQPAGRTLAVFGALADKDIEGIVAPLRPWIAQWWLGGLAAHAPRGLAAADLSARAASALRNAPAVVHDTIEQALRAALAAARSAANEAAADRLLVFGSFHTVAAALATLDTEPASTG